eukprot:TRINITY_DN8199_c0_g1_i1.p1 TRINITY_DN8199_c0_g1~~TRINITY_DN8199_c0_g1_i1.p1  ORF type:complete len:783 (+),score=105.33 TRINITY_DN8199_c0_g1_i1:72-2420(+)
MPLLSITGHIGPVMAVGWSCDGQTFATSSKDKTTRIYESRSETPIATLRGHSERVNSLAFSPKDSNVIATASRDKTIKLFKAASGSLIRTLRGHAGEVYSIAFSPDGGKLVSGSADCNVIIWDVNRATILKKLLGHTQPVLSVAFSTAGRRLVASGGEDGVLKIWNGNTGAVFRNYGGHGDAITAIKFCPLDHNVVVSASRDASIRVWHMDTSTTLAMLTGHADAITSLAFSNDGWLMASGSADATCKVWDVSSCEGLKTFSGHKNTVSGCAFSPGSAMLATSSWDQSAKVWDVSKLGNPGEHPFGLNEAQLTRAPHSASSGHLSSNARQPAMSPTVEKSIPSSKHNTATDRNATKSPLIQRASGQNGSKGSSPRVSSPLSRESSREQVVETLTTKTQPQVVTPDIKQYKPQKYPESELKQEYRKEHKARLQAERQVQQEQTTRRQLEESLDSQRDHETSILQSYKQQIAQLEEDIEHQMAARTEVERSLNVVKESWLYPGSAINTFIELGRGALAVTHRGYFNGAEVCIRTFQEELRGGYYTEVWERELHKRALLKHPNIVEFFGASLDFQEQPKMVLELCPGSLKDVIDIGSELTCREVCDIALGTASGLAYLHGCTLIHSIISTRKILLTCDMKPKLSGISEASVVRRSFIAPPPQLLAIVDSSPGPRTPESGDAQRTRDVMMLGYALVEAAISRPVSSDDIDVSMTRIKWAPLRAILARCFHEEGFKAENLLGQLFQLIMGGSFSEYDKCAPRRYIRRLDTGLIFDTPAKTRTLPTPP